MRKVIVLSGLACGLMLAWAVHPLTAQEMCNDGNFELGKALGPWSLFDDNTGSSFAQYDVDGTGGATWCLERKPGSDYGNGGIKQNVLLVGGVTYQFDADVCYYTC